MGATNNEPVTQGEWEYVWANYIAAKRSGSPTRIAAAKRELEEVNKRIG